MAFSSNGWLYYGNVENNGIDGWNFGSGAPLSSAVEIVSDNNLMQWIGNNIFLKQILIPL